MREYSRNIAFMLDRKEKYPYWVHTTVDMIPTKEFLFWFGTEDNFIFARTNPDSYTWGFETLHGRERLCSHMLKNNIRYKLNYGK